MDKYTLHCTVEQTKIAFRLGAPIHTFTCNEADDKFWKEKEHLYELHTNCFCVIPTCEQMCGWLREEHNITIENHSICGIPFYKVECPGCVIGEDSNCDMVKPYSEVYKLNLLSSIDIALEFIDNHEKIEFINNREKDKYNQSADV